MAEIDFFTFIAENSEPYAEFLYKTAEATKSGNNTINYKCSFDRDNRSVFGFRHVCTVKPYGYPSESHARAIKEALKHADSEYVVMADCDVAMLYEGWDDVVISELGESDIFSATYTNDKRFPSVYFMAFRKDAIKNLDFSPDFTEDGIVKTKITNKSLSELWNVPIGRSIKHDTGIKISHTRKTLGYKWSLMDRVGCCDPDAKLPRYNKTVSAACSRKHSHQPEYHYNGVPFVTHKIASRLHPIHHGYGVIWKNRVVMYLNSIGINVGESIRGLIHYWNYVHTEKQKISKDERHAIIQQRRLEWRKKLKRK